MGFAAFGFLMAGSDDKKKAAAAAKAGIAEIPPVPAAKDVVSTTESTAQHPAKEIAALPAHLHHETSAPKIHTDHADRPEHAASTEHSQHAAPHHPHTVAPETTISKAHHTARVHEHAPALAASGT